MLSYYHANMSPQRHGSTNPHPRGSLLTSMGNAGDRGSLRNAGPAPVAGRGAERAARPVHPRRTGDDGASLARGAAGGPGGVVPANSAGNGRVDGDGDAGGVLAAPRRGRISPRVAATQERAISQRLTVAVPVKGRLHESSLVLLDAAGFQLETRDERALSIRCRSAPIDVLLVRAADVPEYVQDGAVDCGITGADLVGERDADVVELLRLGFGSCTLEAAVLDDDSAQSLPDLHGATVAIVFPHLAPTLLAERGIDVG